jgi:hypothetical protein
MVRTTARPSTRWARCDAQGRLRDDERMTLQGLAAAIESALA